MDSVEIIKAFGEKVGVGFEPGADGSCAFEADGLLVTISDLREIDSLALVDAVESFEAEANNPASLLPLSCIPTGILKVADIPEILSALRKAKMPIRIMHG